MRPHYYNEFDPRNVAMLRQLMADGLIPEGEIDARPIQAVKPTDLDGYAQCHFFAGIGGWALAVRLAGLADRTGLWTGSCPCQPFSNAGDMRGTEDERHLWPYWSTLIRQCKPPIVFGEQVANAISKGWLDGVYADMETEGYACGSAILPACSVDAPHKRDRVWFVADRTSEREHREVRDVREAERGQVCDMQRDVDGAGASLVSHAADGQLQVTQRRPEGRDGSLPVGPVGSDVSDCQFEGREGRLHRGPDTGRENIGGHLGRGGADRPAWGEYDWVICGDGKARRCPKPESGVRMLAYGFPSRVAVLHGFGNAIVPEVAARFMMAVLG